MKYLPRVLKYLRPYWRLAVVSVVILALGSAVALLVPWPLMILVDGVLGGKPLPPAAGRLLGWAAGDRVRLMVVVVLAGFLLVLLQDALNVLGNYVNVRIE